MAIRLLIVDDHAVVRKGLGMLLEDETDIEIVGEASDGDEALLLVDTLKPDILLLDITMPRMSGIDVLKALTRQKQKVQSLMFSMHSTPDYVLKSVQNGASGYLLKDTDREEILKAIRAVIGGELYYPPSASTIIIRQLVLPSVTSLNNETNSPTRTPSIWNEITTREAQILTCLMEGLSSVEIADRFGVSANTVANQRASIIRKAGVKNTVDLIRRALNERLQ